MQRRALTVASVLVLVLGLAACGDDDEDSGGGATGVTISNSQFAVTPVAPGASVEVQNEDGFPHTVTADNGEFDTGQIGGDGTAQFTAPSQAGSYAFHCNVHPTMKATLTVQ
jgi:plastocyanin